MREELAKTKAFQMVPVLRITRRLRALQLSLSVPSRRAPRARYGTMALRVALFLAAVLALRHQLRAVSGDALMPVLRAYDGSQVGLAFALAAFSFLTLGAMEIVTLRAVGARAVPRGKALATAFVAHAFSQSVGVALLSGAAVRLRAYATDALDAVTVARVTTVVTGAISLGLLVLASMPWPGATLIGDPGISYAPIPLVLALVVVFLMWRLSARWLSAAHERSLFSPPPLRTAAVLIGLSAVDWLVTASVLFVLLPPAVPFSYLAFVSVYLVAQAIGMLSHVPGGAGVFEVTILSVLAPAAGTDMRAGLVASLIVYRLVYYLVPLGAAVLAAAAIEARRSRASGAFGSSRPAESAPPNLSIATSRPASAGPSLEADVVESAPRLCAPEWLIDNAEAYDRMLQAIRSARGSVWMTQLAFDADCVAYPRDRPPDSAPPGAGTVLAEALVAAVARAPVDVRILLNATLLLDTTGPLRRFFASRLEALKPIAGTVRIRGLSRFPQLQHSKMVIVDGNEAFLLGSPFANGYWDDPRHAPVDARRPARELGGRPLHDVSVRLTGSPVAELQRIFAELWSVTRSEPGHPPAEEPAPCRLHSGAPGESALAPVRIVCTSPARVLPGAPGGATQIVDALLEGIAGARALIYVEHQYLSARRVVSALVQALRREPDLELIVVLNQNPDVTAYQRWQNARLAESGLLEHPRAGVFALWSVAADARGAGPATLNQVFVHSKVVVVDDLWATGGSANLDGVSLHSYGDDFTGTAGRRIFRNVRNLDVNVVVRDHIAGGSHSRSVADLRARLWSEHLALPVDALARRPADGWLPLWRARAAANVTALSRPAAADGMRGFVLPYSAERTPALQLSDLGLHLDRARIDLRFNPGWLEVHFSPNWVRNMFA